MRVCMLWPTVTVRGKCVVAFGCAARSPRQDEPSVVCDRRCGCAADRRYLLRRARGAQRAESGEYIFLSCNDVFLNFFVHSVFCRRIGADFATRASLRAIATPMRVRLLTLFSLLSSIIHAHRAPDLPRRRTVCSAAVCSAAAIAITPAAATAKSRSTGYTIQQIDGRDWIDVLSSGQYFILRQGGTEPPGSSPLVDEKRRGVFVCAGCVAPLFDSTQKFESGTGWPSFAAARRDVEINGLMPRSPPAFTEVRCGRCGE